MTKRRNLRQMAKDWVKVNIWKMTEHEFEQKHGITFDEANRLYGKGIIQKEWMKYSYPDKKSKPAGEK